MFIFQPYEFIFFRQSANIFFLSSSFVGGEMNRSSAHISSSPCWASTVGLSCWEQSETLHSFPLDFYACQRCLVVVRIWQKLCKSNRPTAGPINTNASCIAKHCWNQHKLISKSSLTFQRDSISYCRSECEGNTKKQTNKNKTRKYLAS